MAACKTCQDPLVLTFDDDHDDDDHDDDDGVAAASTVPDDLLLPCGCHFHWQCLMDQATEVAISLRCPSCDAYLPVNAPGPSATHPFAVPSASPSSGAAAPSAPSALCPPGVSIPTRYANEGGVQDALDILPALTEEAFVSANPAARPARALHLLLAAGDVLAAAELLVNVQGGNDRGGGGGAGGGGGGGGDDDDDDPDAMDDDVDDDGAENRVEQMPLPRLLTWQDPLDGGRAAMHVAIEARREDAVWLLLWAGSALPDDKFPEDVARLAGLAGLRRRDPAAVGGATGRDDDVRFAPDERGRRPADLLRDMGPPWSRFVESGSLFA